MRALRRFAALQCCLLSIAMDFCLRIYSWVECVEAMNCMQDARYRYILMVSTDFKAKGELLYYAVRCALLCLAIAMPCRAVPCLILAPRFKCSSRFILICYSWAANTWEQRHWSPPASHLFMVTVVVVAVFLHFISYSISLYLSISLSLACSLPTSSQMSLSTFCVLSCGHFKPATWLIWVAKQHKPAVARLTHK